MTKTDKLKKLAKKQKIDQERFDLLEKLFDLVESAIIYDTQDYLTMPIDSLYTVVQDAVDYDIKAIQKGEVDPKTFVKSYDNLIDQDNKNNTSIVKLIEQKIQDLSFFAPPNIASQLMECRVEAVDLGFWINVENRVKLIVFLTEESTIDKIHFYGAGDINKTAPEDLDLAMYIYVNRDSIFDQTVMEATKVWHTLAKDYFKKIQDFIPLIVDNLLFFADNGVAKRRFEKVTSSKEMVYEFHVNVLTPDTAVEYLKGKPWRRHFTRRMKIHGTYISYVHAIAKLITFHRYKLSTKVHKQDVN